MKRFLLFLSGWILVDACVDRLYIDIPVSYSDNLVVDGQITNEPGPYTVKLGRVINIKNDEPKPLTPVNAKSISIYDNAGGSEVLNRVADGVYQTSPGGIHGTIGLEYHIRIEMLDGKIFESIPDKMNPVGAVDSIYYNFEVAYQAQINQPTTYQYRIFADAHDVPDGDHYIRWKFNGTYVVETLPQYTHCPPGAGPCAWCPAPCSGYAWIIDLDGVLKLKKGYAYNPDTKKMEYFGLECTCCRCWVTPSEVSPKVADLQLSSAGKFAKMEMGIVPVNFYTFFEKYRVEIMQMSLSRNGFNFWKAMQAQKQAVGSLFQPVTGAIPTNIFEIHDAQGAEGIFYASAVTKRQIYLDRNTNFVQLIEPQDFCNGMLRDGPIGMDCRVAFPGAHATTERPSDWK